MIAGSPVVLVGLVVVIKCRSRLLCVLRLLRLLCLVTRVKTLGRRPARTVRAAFSRRARTAVWEEHPGRPIRQGRGRVLWGRVMRGTLLRRMIRNDRGGTLGPIIPKVAGIDWLSGIRRKAGGEIKIAQRKGLVKVSPPLSWCKPLRRVAHHDGVSLLCLRCGLARAEHIVHRGHEAIVPPEPFLGTLVGVCIAAMPKAIDDVPATTRMVWYSRLLLDEFTD